MEEEQTPTDNSPDDILNNLAAAVYIPKLYIPSTWQPKAAKDTVEEAFSQFDKQLNELHRRLPKTRRYNLSQPQRNVLSEIATRQDLIFNTTDKGLGPSVSERLNYIPDVLNEHLLNKENYEFLPKAQAVLELQKQRRRFLALYAEHEESLISEAEQTYFKRATTANHLSKTRVPQFYGTYKVHKNGRRSRPVVSSVNSIPEIFSKWVDYWLKTVVGRLLPTYVRDSEHLITELHKTFPNGLPKNAKLFSVDAVAMYSNIDTDHGITVLKDWLRLYQDELPPSMPVDFVVAALEEIMKNNIFQFGDTYWRQIRGCAMGTSAAVNYAYLYVGLLEVKRLLPNYKNNLLFFKRFIDDGIGVWIDDPNEPLAWTSFLRSLNNWGTLRWTCDGHQDALVFLDLKISIDAKRNLFFKSYQKPMNLYLYIPPTSAHPSKMLHSLIFGRLRAYKLQNTATTDFVAMATLLAKRLCSRGYSLKTLLPIFQTATNRLVNVPRRPLRSPPMTEARRTLQQCSKTINPMIFHLKYHPRGITRQNVRKIYDETLGPLIPNRRLLIAVSRTKNIGDRVCRTRLPDIPGHNPSDYITCGDNITSPQILPRR
jgi:hypothetical protein